MEEKLLLISLIASHLFVSGVLSGSILTIENKCNETVWPVIFTWGSSKLSPTGFVLRRGEAREIHALSSWLGLISARTLCSTNSTGYFSCATGDCESGTVECPGTYGWSAVTYVYVTIDRDSIYTTISVEYGYNLPLVVVPSQPSQTCVSDGCAVDLNKTCPEDLGLFFMGEKQVGCISACKKYDTQEICCKNDFK